LTCDGAPCGHYLRQFSMSGPESFSISPTRDSTNRGNTYLPPLWGTLKKQFTYDNPPSWDCVPAKGVHKPVGDAPTGTQGCWIAPPLPGTTKSQQFPHILQAKYPNK
jgi:hypothetical protein